MPIDDDVRPRIQLGRDMSAQTYIGTLRARQRIKRDYERLWKQTYDIREKYRKRYRKKERWERDKVGLRLKGLEIYEKTNDEVDRLYRRIFGS